MVARDNEDRADQDPRFELAHFAWGAPDRLEVAGSFAGLTAPPPDAAVLVVHGAERTHRLRPAPDGAPAAEDSGGPWRVDFAWQQVPEVFEMAELHIGGDVVVDLPAPGPAQPQSLPVRHAAEGEGAGDPPPETDAPTSGADRLRMESALLAALEEAGELRVGMERAREELARAHADLEAEREGRAADAERFREGLVQVRDSAETALGEVADTVRQRDAEVKELRDQLAAAGAEVQGLREQLTAAVAARAEAEAAAADAQALRDRVELLASACTVAAETRVDAERLVGRMATIRNALGNQE